MSEVSRRELLKLMGAAGIALGGASAASKLLGPDAPGLFSGTAHAKEFAELPIGKDKVSYGADDIKPGTIIDKGNYKQFPQLKQLLPEHFYNRLSGQHKTPLPPIKIVPTRKFRLVDTEAEWAKKNQGVARINYGTMRLENYQAGIPFLEPKTGLEVVLNYDRGRNEGGDDTHYRKMTFRNFDKYDRTKDLNLKVWLKQRLGRCTLSPAPEYPNNTDRVWRTITTLFTGPYDVAGTSSLRFTYDKNKDDDSWAYIPAMRRIRRLAGADYQDPLFGTDIPYDDFVWFIQKIDFKKVVPVSVEEGRLLSYAFPNKVVDGHTLKTEGRQLIFPYGWEIKDCYIITFKITDPSYCYGKRKIWINKDNYIPHYGEYYDQKGRLWRDWAGAYCCVEETGEKLQCFNEVEDVINGSKTFDFFDHPKYNAPVNDKYFTQSFMKEQGR